MFTTKLFMKNKFSFSKSTMKKFCCSAVIRRPAPHFKSNSYWNGEFKQIALNDFAGKWVTLFFYPLDHTFVCPTEIIMFNDLSPKFEEISKH